MPTPQEKNSLSKTDRELIANLIACAYEMSGQLSHAHRTTRLAPKLFINNDLDSSSKLFELFARNRDLSPSNSRYQYYPELFTLLAMQGAPAQLKRQWISALLGPEISKMPDPELDCLANALGVIGALGFSFPTWRFLAQKLKLPNGTSLMPLLEIAGMERLFRASDKYPTTGAKGNADWLGAGYCREVAGFYVEYRRSYLAILSAEGRALIIRNSSFYFGRDILEAEAYLSTNPVSKAALQDITPQMLNDRERFLPLTEPELYRQAGQKIVSDLSKLTQALLEHNSALFSYLAERNSSPLFTNLTVRLLATGPSGLPVLALIDKGQPPWQPKATLGFAEATPKQLSDFAELAQTTNTDLVLLSGAKGDFPIT